MSMHSQTSYGETKLGYLVTKLLFGHRLQYKSAGSCIPGIERVSWKCSEKNNVNTRIDTDKFFTKFKSVVPPDLYIRECYIHSVVFGKLECFGSGRKTVYNGSRECSFNVDNFPLKYDVLVVNNDDRRRWGGVLCLL